MSAVTTRKMKENVISEANDTNKKVITLSKNPAIPLKSKLLQKLRLLTVHRLFLTFFILLSYFGLGASLIITGSLIIDLTIYLNASEVDVSLVLTFKGIGIVFGGFSVGLITNYISSPKVIRRNRIYNISFLKVYFIGVLMVLIPMYLIPITPSLYMCYIYHFFMGTGSQILLVLGTIIMEFLWKDFSKKIASSMIMCLHLSVVLASFLMLIISGIIFNYNLNAKWNLSLMCWIVAIFLNGSIFLILFKSPEKVNIENIKITQLACVTKKKKKKKKNFKKYVQSVLKKIDFYRILFIIFLSLIMFVYLASDASYVQLLPLYSIKKYPNITKTSASFISSMLLFFACIGRFLSTFVPLFIPVSVILAFDFVIILGVFITYVFFHQYEIFMWILSPILGFCYSTIFGSMSVLPKEFEMEITGFETSVMMFPVGFGFVLPSLMTYLMEVWTIDMYLYLNLSYVIIFNVLFLITLGVGYYIRKRNRKIKEKITPQKDIKNKEHSNNKNKEEVSNDKNEEEDSECKNKIDISKLEE